MRLRFGLCQAGLSLMLKWSGIDCLEAFGDVMAHSIETELLEFSHDLSWDQVPKITQEILCLSLLDWAAVGLAGAHEPVSTALRGLERLDSGQGTANVFGAKHRLSVRTAALINGATSHALDYDDTHFYILVIPPWWFFRPVWPWHSRWARRARNFLRPLWLAMKHPAESVIGWGARITRPVFT